MKKLIEDINGLLGDKKLTGELLVRVFEKWWPELERDIASSSSGVEEAARARSPDSMLSEVLDLTRFISKNLGSVNPHLLRKTADESEETVLVRLNSYGCIRSPEDGDWNHPVLVQLSPFPGDSDNTFDVVSISHRGIERTSLGDKSGTRGIEIELFFFCEENYYWSVRFSFHKGMTYGKVRLIDDEEVKKIGLDNATIWRD